MLWKNYWSPQANASPKMLPSSSPENKYSHSSQGTVFEKFFSPSAERGGGHYVTIGIILTYFMPIASFYTSLKYQKVRLMKQTIRMKLVNRLNTMKVKTKASCFYTFYWAALNGFTSFALDSQNEFLKKNSCTFVLHVTLE